MLQDTQGFPSPNFSLFIGENPSVSRRDVRAGVPGGGTGAP